ncbi:MAG: transposase [Minisyncoccia bacterium]
MKQYRIAPEVKEQIINRIKNDGVTVAQAAKEHGIHETTIYGWLGAKVQDGTASVLEIARLRKENDELLRLVGLMTLKLSETQKKK